MAREWRTPSRQKYITHKIKSTRRRDLGIKYADSAGSGIARACEDLSALLSLLAIELLKSLNRHKNLAANLKIRRQPYSFAFRQIHAQRDRADRADVCRNVFPGSAVAAGNAGNKHSALITQ